MARIGKAAIDSLLQNVWWSVFAWVATMIVSTYGLASEPWEMAFIAVGAVGALTGIVMFSVVASFLRARYRLPVVVMKRQTFNEIVKGYEALEHDNEELREQIQGPAAERSEGVGNAESGEQLENSEPTVALPQGDPELEKQRRRMMLHAWGYAPGGYYSVELLSPPSETGERVFTDKHPLDLMDLISHRDTEVQNRQRTARYVGQWLALKAHIIDVSEPEWVTVSNPEPIHLSLYSGRDDAGLHAAFAKPVPADLRYARRDDVVEFEGRINRIEREHLWLGRCRVR